MKRHLFLTICLLLVATAVTAAEASGPHGLDFSEVLFVQRLHNQSIHFYTHFIEFNPGDGYFRADNGIYRYDMNTSIKTAVITAADIPGSGTGVFDRYDLDWDMSRVVFDYKNASDEGYRIWMCNLDGSGLTQITTTPANEADNVSRYSGVDPADGPYGKNYFRYYDDMHPCFTQDGTIIFVSTRAENAVLCNGPGFLTVPTLHSISTNGTDMKQLTDSALSEFAPSMMEDGRVVYTRWEYVDKDSLYCKSIFAMNPDGTHHNEIFGLDQHCPPTFNYPRQIPGKPNKFVLATAPHYPNGGEILGPIVVVDRTKEVRSHQDPYSTTPGAAVTYVTPDIQIWGEQGWNFQTGSQQLYTAPYPISEERFLVTCKQNDSAAWNTRDGYGIYLLDSQGGLTHTEIVNVSGTSCWCPMPLKSRVKPMSINALKFPSGFFPGGATNMALALVTDVSRGTEGLVATNEIKYLRVNIQISRPWSAAGWMEWPTRLWPQIQMGIVPVEDDGSAYFYVPANRSVFLQALDSEYREVQRERTYVTWQPGEFRSCVGCHEKSGKAPPQIRGTNQTVMALQSGPVLPGPMPGEAAQSGGTWDGWGAKVIYYEHDIQPILDANCVSCHTHADEMNGWYQSYNYFLNGELCGPAIEENNDNMTTDLSQFEPPKTYGSHASTLADELTAPMRSEHTGVLTDSERYQLYRWIDSNYQLYGTYFDWETSRTMPTVDEALSHEAPAWQTTTYE
jgi:hypothetical protein